MDILRGRNSAGLLSGDLVMRLTEVTVDPRHEPFVKDCLVQSNEPMTLRVPTFRDVDINGNIGRPAKPLLMPIYASDGERKLFEVNARASMGQGMLRTGPSRLYNDRALAAMKVPSVIRSADGTVLGAICTAQNKLGIAEPDGGGTRSLIALSTQPMHESQEPVDVQLDGTTSTAGMPMFCWVKQSCSPVSDKSTGSNTHKLFLASASGGFEPKPSYTFVKRADTLFHDLKVSWKADPFTLTEVESGAKVATSKVRAEPAGPEPSELSQCWYEVDVVPGMDASLVALAAIMDGLLVDELAYREPN